MRIVLLCVISPDVLWQPIRGRHIWRGTRLAPIDMFGTVVVREYRTGLEFHYRIRRVVGRFEVVRERQCTGRHLQIPQNDQI